MLQKISLLFRYSPFGYNFWHMYYPASSISLNLKYLLFCNKLWCLIISLFPSNTLSARVFISWVFVPVYSESYLRSYNLSWRRFYFSFGVSLSRSTLLSQVGWWSFFSMANINFMHPQQKNTSWNFILFTISSYCFEKSL